LPTVTAETKKDTAPDEQERAAVLERYLVAVDCSRRILEMEHDPVLFVERAHKFAHPWTQNTFDRRFFWRDHMDINSTDAKCGRDFESDEARTKNNRSTRSFGARDDSPAVRKGPERMNMRLVGTRDRQADRLGAGREQQAIVQDFAPIGEHAPTRARIDAVDICVETLICGFR
jgi:hypothetical protein